MTPREAMRRQVTTRLLAARAELGYVPHAMVVDAARETGRSERTVWRWLRDPRVVDDADAAAGPARPKRDRVNDDVLEVFYALSGNVAATFREVTAAGIDVGSETTLRRALAEQGSDIVAYAGEGAAGLRQRQLFCRWQAELRNDIWQIDHEELPLCVIPAGSTIPVRPWVTVVLDDATRLLLAFIVTFDAPGADEVLACLADAIREKAVDGGAATRVGGVPRRIMADNAAEFRGERYGCMLAALGVEAHFSYPYQPQSRGKVERLMRTTQDEFALTLPGYSHGPLTLSGRDLFGAEHEPLHEAEFLTRLAAWRDWYNEERTHTELDGRTPLAAWCDDATPLRLVDDDELLSSMLIDEGERIVQPSGVHVRGGYLTSRALAGHVGERVKVRCLPHDDDLAWVYTRDGECLGSVRAHHAVSDAEREQIVRDRRAAYLTARGFHQRATDRRRRAAEHNRGAAINRVAAAPPATGLRSDDDGLLELADPPATLRIRDDADAAPEALPAGESWLDLADQ